MTADEAERLETIASIMGNLCALILVVAKVPAAAPVAGALQAVGELAAFIEEDLTTVAERGRKGQS